MKYITIEYRSYNKKILLNYLKKFNSQLLLSNINIFMHKKRKHLITLQRSPHGYKKAREQFSITHHKYSIRIKDPKIMPLIKSLTLNKPTAVSAHIIFKATN